METIFSIVLFVLGIKSGEAPEVAEIIHERYDTELEMAKSLMQQEFDETLESEQVGVVCPISRLWARKCTDICLSIDLLSVWCQG